MASSDNVYNVPTDKNLEKGDEAVGFMGPVSSLIEKAVNDALAENPVETALKQKRVANSPSVSRNTRKTSSQGTTSGKGEIDSAMVGDIVSRVLNAVTPMIAQVVKAAVASSTELILKKLDDTSKEMKRETAQTVNQVKEEVQAQKFELDKLEQYGRRDNIKIFGIPPEENENTNQLVVDLAADIGVSISSNDISVSHRLPGGRNDRPKPIIVKFVRRDTKSSIMKRKKELKKKENRKEVYVQEDLTPLRSKIFKELKRDRDNIKRVWTVDGKINCIIEEGQYEVKKIINSPYDLVKVGWSAEKINELNLYIPF